jgi:hypothetical protein
MSRTFRNLILCLITVLPAEAGDLKLTETKESLRITLKGKPVLEYLKKEKQVPDGMKKSYRRSGYLHPVFSPGGQEVSGDFPEDHPHQHGLFFAWTRTEFDGSKVDFWNLAKETGRVEFREMLGKEINDRKASFSVRHAFVAGKGKARKDVLDEIWKVTIHQTTDDHFLFDIRSEQKCATQLPLTLPKYKYGGMAFRGNSQWLNSKEGQANDFRFITSEGKDRLEGNHSRPNWVTMTGMIDGKTSTITIMNHPRNFRSPQAVRLHPEKPYFCFAPMVTGDFQIKPGQPYVSNYRYLVTSKEPDQKLIERIWQDYQKTAP